MNKYLIVLLLCICSQNIVSAAQQLPRHESVPGGIALVSLDNIGRPKVYYGKYPVMVIGENKNWLAVVGIPLSAKPGGHELVVNPDNEGSIYNFEVKNKQYEKQYLKIKNKWQVNPGTDDMQRINKEKELIAKAKTTWRDNEFISLNLSKPVEGSYSSPFGLRRFFNNQPRKPHSGLDIIAPEGTPVKAAADGIINNIGDYFFNGKTVFIDHGLGMITMYCHLSSIAVKLNDYIKQGDIIGAVGQTGRVTGAHLHWGIILNNTSINPLLFLSDDKF